MSTPYGPFTLTAGTLAPVTTTQYPDTSTIVLINESPFTLKVDPGTGGYYVISAFTQDKILLGNQYSGQLKITPVADINTSGEAPSTILYVMGYAFGEPVPGNYPAGLTRMANVGNSVLQANQVFQTGQVVPTPAVEATPNPSFASAPSLLEAVINNDGSFTLGNAGTLITNEGLALVHDGTGILTARQYNIGFPGANMPAVSFNGRSPIQLQAGAQETGSCGVVENNCVNTSTIGVRQCFSTRMTNVPTSISFVDITTLNAGAISTPNIDKTGFTIVWTPAAAGQSFRIETYTTVGN